MSTDSQSTRAALRTFVVVAMSLLVLIAGGLDMRRIWIPVGVFGYATDGDLTVNYIEDGSPAAKAGMRVGDIIELQATPAQFRWYAAQAGTLESGESITFALMHQGVLHMVTLTAMPQVTEHYYTAYRIAVLGVAALYIVLGAALVLLRPSLMTWGFFLYCLANAPFTFYAISLFYPFPWPYMEYPLQYTLSAAGTVGLLVFALCFLNEPVQGWRRSALRTMPWFFVALIAFGVFFTYHWGWIGGPPGELLTRVYVGIAAVWALVVMYLFVDTYVHARGEDRQRIRWVVVGFGINLVVQFVSLFLSVYVPSEPIWLAHVLALSSVIVPLTVAYAVIKHRVIDVSFVVSRTLVYGVLTTLLVCVFSVIDWFFSDYLRLARLGTVAEVGAVVAFGLWFNGLHRRVDSLIDATFFRQRHRAEKQLARNAAALPFATTPQNVAQALIKEPVRALGLASAALFRRGKEGAFVREDSDGWNANDISRLDDDDGHLLMLLQAENGPVSLYEHPWRSEGTPSGPAHPVLALPIIVRRELAAVVFYGSHIHGEGLDPDEIRTIAGLAPGAAAAYDHLDAQSMKREVESIRRENESLRIELAEAQIQPA
jgi:hypothetical protein